LAHVFVSHAHADKPIARRVARRLEDFGIRAWLDERELRIGTALGGAVEEAVREAAVMVVIATARASNSKWVEREVQFAQSLTPSRPICPLFVEHVDDPLLADHLGVDATDPHWFESAVLKLAEAIHGEALPPPSRERLQLDLQSIAQEEPHLAPLVDACLSGHGLHGSQLDGVANANWHALDFALNNLYELHDGAARTLVARHAALFFSRNGVGTAILSKHARSADHSDGVIATAVGSKLRPAEFDAALELLSIRSDRDDHALMLFIHANSGSLGDPQLAHAIRLVTHPARGPAGFGIDAACAALRVRPDSADLRFLWTRWVESGEFDGGDTRQRPDQLAWQLADLEREDPGKWDFLVEALRSHVRRLARSTDRRRVYTAVDYIIKAADRSLPWLRDLARECTAAAGSAEWDGWPEAEEMSTYVGAFVGAAETDRDWGRALRAFEQTWANAQAREVSRKREI
jgi:hypothetical protein